MLIIFTQKLNCCIFLYIYSYTVQYIFYLFILTTQIIMKTRERRKIKKRREKFKDFYFISFCVDTTQKLAGQRASRATIGSYLASYVLPIPTLILPYSSPIPWEPYENRNGEAHGITEKSPTQKINQDTFLTINKKKL